MGATRIWWALTVAGFRRHTAYRGAQLAGAAANTVFGLLRASVLTAAIASGGGAVAGYDERTAIAFVFISQALIWPVQIFPPTELADRVRSGDIAIELARPAALQVQYGFADLGRAAATLLPNVVPPLLVGMAFFGFFLPAGVEPYALGLPAVVLAVAVASASHFLVGISSFWLVEIRGVHRLYSILIGILSGMIVPVTWFPDWLRTVAVLSPFPSFVQVPADILAGRVQGWTALGHLGFQAGWLVVLTLLGWVALRAGTRRLVVQGG